MTRQPTRPSPADVGLVRRQLGREPHPFHRVVARCPWGAPAVVEDLPYDAAGRPFPTLYWATCPSLVAAIGRLESGGGVKRFEAAVAGEPELARSLAAATRHERRRRRDLVALYDLPMSDGGASLRTGIGGVSARTTHPSGASTARPSGAPTLKCLHAHAAHALARPGYALGERILAEAAPLYPASDCCTQGCTPGGTPAQTREGAHERRSKRHRPGH